MAQDRSLGLENSAAGKRLDRHNEENAKKKTSSL